MEYKLGEKAFVVTRVPGNLCHSSHKVNPSNKWDAINVALRRSAKNKINYAVVPVVRRKSRSHMPEFAYKVQQLKKPTPRNLHDRTPEGYVVTPQLEVYHATFSK